MHRMNRQIRDEAGSALITALLCTVVMLGLGMALLAIVDTQARESASERTRDRAFNLAESVLTSEAFVLGRNWPEQASTVGAPSLCSVAGPGFGEEINATTPSLLPEVARLRNNLDASYDPAADPAFAGASWKVNICDDNSPATVWEESLRTNPSYDANKNKLMWVRAQATVDGKTRSLVGLVRVNLSPALNPRYALVSGGLADDLGSTVNVLTNNGLLGKVVSGLLTTTPTVAADTTIGAPTPNGVTGLRCGALDIKDGSTCVTGTLGAVTGPPPGGVPLVGNLVTGGKIENFPTTTAATEEAIARLRQQAKTALTYTPESAGTAPTASPNPLLNPNDTAPSVVTPCTINGTPNQDTVIFIEKVGVGAGGSVGGPGDQYCSIDVSVAKRYKAIVVGSGRVVIRGNNTTTLASNTGVNTFTGVVYALNLQRHPVTSGGLGLGDVAGREVLRVDKGAHVRGGVNADGKSAKVGIYPPPLTIDTTALKNALVPLIPCEVPPLVCLLRTTVQALSGVLALVDGLVGALGLDPVVSNLLGQLNPQRAQYGSAITADVAVINALTVHGASGVVTGSFRDLQAR